MKLLLHPLPIRIFHWVMFSCVMTLMATGFYIHSPPEWLVLPISQVRKVHGIFGLLLLFNVFGHVYYYIYTGKYTEILLRPSDWVNVRSFIRYYLFITEGHPNYGRYNPGQKALFTAWGLASSLAGLTGMVLLLPDDTAWLQRYIGGLSGARIIQYSIGVLFAATVPFHLYLVFTEDPAKLQAIFTGYIRKEPKLKKMKEQSP